jgi:uncharacterized membrane protein YedE/YeeE
MNTSPWLKAAAALIAGTVFGVGLALAGMTDPLKVLGFLDLAGAWDASLLFVLGGAADHHAGVLAAAPPRRPAARHRLPPPHGHPR